MNKYVQTNYRLSYKKPGMDAGSVRLAFLTDLHGCSWGTDNEELIFMIKEAGCDLALCGGDTIVAKQGADFRAASSFLKKLAAQLPVLHAFGNHEARYTADPAKYGGDIKGYIGSLEDAGVIFLVNERARVDINGIGLSVYGYDPAARFYKRFDKAKPAAEDLFRKLNGAPDQDRVSILLAHTPSFLESYIKWGADLTLCGHFHGGVAGLPGNVSLIGPEGELFTKRARGHFRIGRKHAIISAGLGEHTIPVRINNPRELVIIDIDINK